MIIHADKVRWLFWLRWKTLLRSFTRSSGRVSRIVGGIFLLIFGLPVIGSVAVGTYFAYRLLPAPANIEALFLVLTGMYILWAILPIFEFSANEGLDLSKLTLFPLTRAELMVSLLISTLLDIPTLGLFLVFAAVVAGWSYSLPLGLMALLAMLVFYTSVIGTSQLVLALLMRVLQSRRFRDLSIILIVLLSSSGYLCQFVFRGIGSGNVLRLLQNDSFSRYLQWFPPGMAARVIQQAYIGNWTASFAWLGALLLVSLLALYLWQTVVERALSNPESGELPGMARRRGRAPSVEISGPSAASQPGIWQRLLAPQVMALTIKDLKYFRRDPQLQAMLLQSVMSMVFLVFITVINTGGSGGRLSFFGNWTVLISPAFIFLSLYTLSYNVLGFERQSLSMLLLFPVEPRRILWSKNIVVLGLGMTEMLLLVLLTAAFAHAWSLALPALAIGIAGIAVVLGCGNFTSVYFPQRMRQAQRGFQSSANLSAGGGCLRAVLSMVAFVAMVIILLPVITALVLPIFFHIEWVWALSIPASLLYGAAFYFVVTTLVARRMVARTPEILEAIVRE
jgi:ABC-2 type transport system permease protein